VDSLNAGKEANPKSPPMAPLGYVTVPSTTYKSPRQRFWKLYSDRDNATRDDTAPGGSIRVIVEVGRLLNLQMQVSYRPGRSPGQRLGNSSMSRTISRIVCISSSRGSYIIDCY